jgi:hypothetical protein
MSLDDAADGDGVLSFLYACRSDSPAGASWYCECEDVGRRRFAS